MIKNKGWGLAFVISVLFHLLLLFSFQLTPTTLPTFSVQSGGLTLLSSPIAQTVSPSPKTNHRAAIKKALKPTSQGGADSKSPPSLINNPAPPYPEDARKQRVEGKVIARLSINEKGIVESVSVVKSSGNNLLDQSALTTLKTWRFSPGRSNGKSEPSQVEIPIQFKLK